jgi:hypothetical protein
MSAVEHYLPQFLLRGFAVQGKKQHVYHFRRGKEPHLTNVRNVAGERGFYGAVGADSVESALGTRENQYAPLIEQLRLRDPEPADKALIDAFVLHLFARGRHLRSSFVEFARSGIARWRGP